MGKQKIRYFSEKIGVYQVELCKKGQTKGKQKTINGQTTDKQKTNKGQQTRMKRILKIL